MELNAEHHYQIMREILWSDKFEGEVVGRIRWKIEQLAVLLENADYTESETELEYLRSRVKEYVVSLLWLTYITKKPYERYTDDYSLSTYLVHYMDYQLFHILRRVVKYQRRDDLMEAYDDFKHTDGWTPEKALEHKQKLELMSKIFDEIDIEVLEKRLSRKDAAEELGMSYEAYKKSLQRKKAKFEDQWNA